MTRVIICFSKRGAALVKKLNEGLKHKGLPEATAYISADPDIHAAEPSFFGGFIRTTADDFAREGFANRSVLIFVGAAGIAVRAVSPYVKDKLTDSPVIVIDDEGNYVIPILSGHAGGANKEAVILAEVLGAHPVITTSTDIAGAFSADVFAKENNLAIKGKEGIRRVSAKAIEGKPVTVSIKDYPPTEPVDIIIADETDRQYSLLLSPKKYVIGIGTKKGIDPVTAREFILSVLAANEISTDDIYCLSTIDIKENEPAIRKFCDRFGIALITFEASVLARAQGNFSSSDFVKETVGVDNVCERAAVLAAGPGARLIVRKTAGDGITVAVAQRR